MTDWSKWGLLGRPGQIKKLTREAGTDGAQSRRGIMGMTPRRYRTGTPGDLDQRVITRFQGSQGSLGKPLPGAQTEFAHPTDLTSFDGRTPIDRDRAHPSFKISPSTAKSYLRECADAKLAMTRAGPDGAEGNRQIEGLADFIYKHFNAEDEMTREEEEFWIDFLSWLVGTPRRLEDWKNTDWLKSFVDPRNPRMYDNRNVNLAYSHKDVADFVNMFIEAKGKFKVQKELLKQTGPANLTESYLYYKYIVRKLNEDYMADLNDFRRNEAPSVAPPPPLASAPPLPPPSPSAPPLPLIPPPLPALYSEDENEGEGEGDNKCTTTALCLCCFPD